MSWTNFRSSTQGPRPGPRHHSNSSHSHQYSSSRASNNLPTLGEGAQLAANPVSPISPPPGTSMASPGIRTAQIARDSIASWTTAGSSMRSQSPYYQPPAAPISPGGSEPHPWASGATFGSATHNGSNGTLSISSGRPSQEEDFVSRYEQRIMFIYNAVAGGVGVQFILTVEAAPLSPDESVLTLTFKAGGIERSICGKEYMRLSVDPQLLRFRIFIFPKPSLPADCLYCVRVWLEAQGVQHRIFSDENLWVGRDPPFASIQHVALTQQGPPTIPFPTRSEAGVIRRAYKGFVGRAACDFIVILKNLSADSVWGISIEYQAGGISRLLFEQTKVRLHCRVEDVKFIIYSVPIDSSIPYSNHRVRVWMKGLDGVNQRLFKSDEFRIGAQLAFEPLLHGPGNVSFATMDASSPTIALHSSLLHNDPPKGSPVPNGNRPGTSRQSTMIGPERQAREQEEYEERRMGISVGIGNGPGSGSGGNLPFDESLPSYNAALGVGI